MAIEWDKSLSVGVKLVDDQHRELFRMVNGLVQAMMENRGQEELGKLLGFLSVYVVEHFGAEERLMAKYRYPGELTHRRQHADFVKKLLGVKAAFDDFGPSPQLAVTMGQFIARWLREHIAGSDVELGKFLMAEGAQEAAR